MTITINLPADVAARLSDKAAREGQNVVALMQQLAVREAGLAQTETVAAWNALLDSFDDGEAQDHQETIAALTHALNEDRPGQRRIFGEGINPA